MSNEIFINIESMRDPDMNKHQHKQVFDRSLNVHFFKTFHFICLKTTRSKIDLDWFNFWSNFNRFLAYSSNFLIPIYKKKQQEIYNIFII